MLSQRLQCVGAERFVVLVVLMLTLAVPATAALLPVEGYVDLAAGYSMEWTGDALQQVGGPSQLSSSGSLTVCAELHVDEALSLDDTERVWLAGLASRPGIAPDVLALSVVEEGTGWWPTWMVRLEGLVTTDLGSIVLVPGRSYKTYLSLDPDTGAVSVVVYDSTLGEMQVAGGYQGDCYAGPLHACVGIRYVRSPEVSAGIGFEKPTVIEGYLPVGTTWQVVAKGPDDSGFAPMWQFEETYQAGLRLLTSPVPTPGEFRLSVKEEGLTIPIGCVAQPHGEIWMPLPVSEMRPGRSVLTLEYVVDEQARLAEQLEVVLGSIDIVFSPVHVDREAGLLRSEAVLWGRSSAKGVPVRIRADMTELVWDEAKCTYHENPYASLEVLATDVDLSRESGPVAVPLEWTVPAQRGFFRVVLTADIGLSVLVRNSQQEHLLAYYEPAEIAPREPFTIAVLPDTQYYASDYPEIFIRQTQWLAENAADRKIGLMLHLGDITDNNSPPQWAVAKRSIALLDGTVPYALCPGNHDMIGSEGALRHSDTLLDRYFPSVKFPALAGTFAEGEISNSYHLFELAGEDYLVLSLEFGPRDGVLEWANQVVAKYPHHKVIVITHAYTARSGQRVTTFTSSASPHAYPVAKLASVNDGEEMWDTFVRRHGNMFMVLSGHIGVAALPRNMAVGEKGNTVYEILADYQFEPMGGEGTLVLLDITPGEQVVVRGYSPYLGEYKRGWDSYGFNNSFVIDLENERLGMCLGPEACGQ